jgi:phosphate ABC transporter permease protein PstC
VKPASERPNAAATDFDRPLLLTAAEDMAGYCAAVVGRVVLLAVALTSVVAVLLICFFILREAWPFFVTKGAALFGGTKWFPTAEPAEFGALAQFAGSAYVTLGAMLVAVPVGLLTAVFLSDIAPFRLRQVAKPIIELLAAIPSVAYGFFAVLVLAPWMQRVLGLPTGTNALNASLILAVMAIPTIVSVSEDALSAVGRDLREGSYSLGATRAETLIKVVIPAAHSGIVAAVILGTMRAIGETMVVWMASGNANQIPSPWWDITQSVRTVTATIAGELNEAPKGSEHYYALFGLGAVLLVFTFAMNLVSEHFLARAKRVHTGGGT